MFILLRENVHKKCIVISDDFKCDLKWFNSLITAFNGVSFFNYVLSKLVHLDAGPSGFGAIFDNQAYALSLPEFWKDKILHILNYLMC